MILLSIKKHQPNRPICIYVAIGQKDSNIGRIQKILEEKGAMEYTVIVDAPASVAPALQFIAPYAGASIGEYFMKIGQHALCVYDDLSKHAQAYRAMGACCSDVRQVEKLIRVTCFICTAAC